MIMEKDMGMSKWVYEMSVVEYNNVLMYYHPCSTANWTKSVILRLSHAAQYR